jgi:hypothetical protein
MAKLSRRALVARLRDIAAIPRFDLDQFKIVAHNLLSTIDWRSGSAVCGKVIKLSVAR